MRFLCDMGISMVVANWLRSHGHECLHLREQGLQRLPDIDIFKKARDERRIVLTFDLDFGEIAAAAESVATSVIIFRVRNTRPVYTIGRLETAMKEAGTAIERGAIVVIEDARIRIRDLPLSTDRP